MFIAISGYYGCIPTFSEKYSHYDEAVEALSKLHNLIGEAETELRDNTIIHMGVKNKDVHYCEIVKKGD